jgi:hypothetical protein
MDIRAEQPERFYPVLVTSVVLAATKIRLPCCRAAPRCRCRTAPTLRRCRSSARSRPPFIIAVSVWAQCALNNAGRMATYRTVFSIANIIVATAVTHAAAGLVGGLAVRDDWTALVVPALAGATAFFFCNTLLLAQAVALESKKSPAVLWREQFLWSAPACFVGAGVGVSAAYLIETASRLAAFVAIPVVLFYWGYRTYLGFIEKQETMHLATVEALARAIGARDQTLEASKTVSDTHVRRVQRLAVTLARRAGMGADEVKGRGGGGPAPRHREAGGARAHPQQADQAHARGAEADPDAPDGGRGDHRRRRLRLPGGAAHRVAPRTLERRGLSEGSQG